MKSDWLKILVQSVIMLAIGSALAAYGLHFPVPDYGLILADLVVGIAAIVATIAASNFLADRVLDILTDNITRSRCSLVGKPSKDA